MKALKQLALFFLGGAPVGATVTSFIAPPIIKVFHTAAGERSALCNCTELADNIMRSFWWAQAGGTIAGGIGGVILWAVLKRRGKLQG